MDVAGGPLSQPRLSNYSSSVSDSYTMTVARYEISYSVLDCGFGMGLLIGSYNGEAGDDTIGVQMEQVSPDWAWPCLRLNFMLSQLQEASRPVGGSFNITIGDKILGNVSVGITSNNLETLMDNTFPEQGGWTSANAWSDMYYQTHTYCCVHDRV